MCMWYVMWRMKETKSLLKAYFYILHDQCVRDSVCVHVLSRVTVLLLWLYVIRAEYV